jgi:hypothetical protein
MIFMTLDPFPAKATEPFCVDVKQTAGYVQVTAIHPATLVASWRGPGRVEVVVAGRALTVERVGAGIRVVNGASGLPLAGFTPDRSWLRRRGAGRPGTVLLADGSVLRWVLPTASDFECGFFKGPHNVLRYAYDGSASFCAGGAASAGIAGVSVEKVALLVLGWLLLLELGSGPATRTDSSRYAGDRVR